MARLVDIVRPSRLPGLPYELLPGFSGDFIREGARVEVNEDGYRGPRIPVQEEGATRVVGIGDSVLFGWGVAEGESYFERAAALLSETRTVEFVNLGVPGYNTWLEVEALQARGLAYAPDVVVLGWVSNDTMVPNFVFPPSPIGDLDRSFLLDWARNVMSGARDTNTLRLHGLYKRPAKDPTHTAVSGMPPGTLGWEGVERALDRLATLASAHGFGVLVVTHTGPRRRDWKRVQPLAAARGFMTCALGEEIDARLAAQGLRDPRGTPWALGPEDRHPSSRAHALLGAALARELEGLLPPTRGSGP